MKKPFLLAVFALMVFSAEAQSLAGEIGLKGGFRYITMDDEEILIGGDIILQLDDILITGEKSVYQIWDYLDKVESTITHRLKVLRAGEVQEIRLVSSDCIPK